MVRTFCFLHEYFSLTVRISEVELKLLKLYISGTIYSRYIAILQPGLQEAMQGFTKVSGGV